MKLIHFSDTHLGFNDLDVINEESINQRETDFYDAFTQVIEQIKAIKPDYIIHTGNYSTPRINLSSPILKMFENFKNIYVVYSQEYKKIEFDNVIFHALPHMHDESKALYQIELCEHLCDQTTCFALRSPKY